MVDDEQGHSLPVSALSRGTREQLFLAVRLAAVEELSQKGVSLPMILDDVFVNFDAGLIRIDDVNQWTTQVYGIGQIGKLADLSVRNISLRLIGCPLIAHGRRLGVSQAR